MKIIDLLSRKELVFWTLFFFLGLVFSVFLLTLMFLGERVLMSEIIEGFIIVALMFWLFIFNLRMLLKK